MYAKSSFKKVYKLIGARWTYYLVYLMRIGIFTLVYKISIVAVLELFLLVFFSAASFRGQCKLIFPLTVILEPSVKMLFSLSVFLKKTASQNNIYTDGFLKKPPVKITIPLAVFLNNC